MKRVTLLVLGILICLMSSPVWAQHAPGQMALTPYVSWIKLVGGEGDHSVVNYTTGLALKYSFSQRLSGELSLGLGWVRPRDPDSYFQVRENAPYKTYVYPLGLNLRWNLATQRFVPYLIGGVGLTMWDLRDLSGEEDKFFPIPPSGNSVHDLQTNFSILTGLGTTIFLTPRLGLDLAFRYTHLLDQSLDNIGTGDPNTGLAEFRVGLSFHFGGTRDSDGDGIQDEYDAAPQLAEDFDNFMDEDGAPDYDNDEDGIPDELDQAPNLPEDLDGFQDDDGIPDLDNDDDGIPDSQDSCPNNAEDFDNFEDQDGCPDLDNDNDTIPDTMDKCPMQPENFNGIEDDDGCPEEEELTQTEAIDLQSDTPLVLPGITFETASSTLTTNAQTILEDVYQSLAAHPGTRVEIRGFTDSVGSASSNLNLSQRRADSVKNYLVKRGISFDRLRAIGYGEANPIASNATREGRAQNRRIEFLKLED